MRNFIFSFSLLNILTLFAAKAQNAIVKQANDMLAGMTLVWSDEFNQSSKPDTAKWSYETGFVRNEEHQWYTTDNAFISKGKLIIEGRKEKVSNPNYQAGARNWRQNREFAEFTSASINTRDKFSFQYGVLEVKARIDTAMGLWPAIWTLGISKEWPSCGEIDIMESYPIDGVHYILANTAWGTTRRYNAKWNSSKILLKYFLDKDPRWPQKYHIWRMVWDEQFIRLYLDDELLTETNLEDTYNADGFNPFHQPHYILLNLAIGGQNGGDPSNTKFPTRYEVDYVRVYQRKY